MAQCGDPVTLAPPQVPEADAIYVIEVDKLLLGPVDHGAQHVAGPDDADLVRQLPGKGVLRHGAPRPPVGPSHPVGHPLLPRRPVARDRQRLHQIVRQLLGRQRKERNLANRRPPAPSNIALAALPCRRALPRAEGKPCFQLRRISERRRAHQHDPGEGDGAGCRRRRWWWWWWADDGRAGQRTRAQRGGAVGQAGRRQQRDQLDGDVAAQAPAEHGDAAAHAQGGQRVCGHDGVARLRVDAVRLSVGGCVARSPVAWVVEGDDAAYAGRWVAGEDVGKCQGAG
ncbi:uncharacterized protein PgNI_08333 [Pyricularia grisea]|uniref:Uncharacterized protein n=1 Tax=Pyricularia grisea TaxID=148305 RepID=A0A6P8AV53_PYRGI|nr:uncharacterized protein PgNI_08333 [Pyricularia grisea]TLD06101.1 hypothetical protein PgNI_08333 [Pyricularia grisea]